MKNSAARILIPALGLLCLWPAVSSPLALCMGVAVALLVGNPYIARTKALTPKLLAYSIVGLGFGMNLLVLAKVGMQGLGYTVVGIVSTLFIGWLLGRLYKTDRDISLLITVGTAICGGSAIAAVAAVIRARSQDMTVALGTVFLLNALALVIFPPLGHHFSLSQDQFGLWSALAIHDTSSVVGASMQYGARALEVGTTVKLARALWIVPTALTIGYVRSKDAHAPAGGFKKPWFILGFVLAAAAMTWLPALQPYGHWLELAGRRVLVLTLFLIGAGLTRATLKAVGLRPFLQGVTLWLIVSAVTLAVIVSRA
jgi:uncharacterized integral membrane protein (TIGR00698 family)